ncbi:hypothetical protein N665_1330s0002 [Sinapis alba]|nr:hypothetical protein N665_1330s0002 [Sinapis alba]
MRYSVMFMVSCVFTFLVLSNVKGGSNEKLGCNITRVFRGTCGNNGKTRCVNDFIKILKPKNVGMSCKCNDLPNPVNAFHYRFSHPDIKSKPT